LLLGAENEVVVEVNYGLHTKRYATRRRAGA